LRRRQGGLRARGRGEPALTRKIIIRNVAWLVAWDEAGQSHCYRRDVDLAIEGDTIAKPGRIAKPRPSISTASL